MLTVRESSALMGRNQDHCGVRNGAAIRSLCMHVRLVRGVIAAAAVCLATPAVAMASDVQHTSVASEDPVAWTPNLLSTPTVDRPVAYSITQAGDLMVVGGNFRAVE